MISRCQSQVLTFQDSFLCVVFELSEENDITRTHEDVRAFPTIEWLKQNKSESLVMFSLSILRLIISEICSSLCICILLLVLFLFKWICEEIHFDGLLRTVSLWYQGYSLDCSESLIPSAKYRVNLLRRSAFALSAVGKDVTLTKRFRHSSTSSGRIVTSVEHYLCMSVLLQFSSSKKRESELIPSVRLVAVKSKGCCCQTLRDLGMSLSFIKVFRGIFLKNDNEDVTRKIKSQK